MPAPETVNNLPVVLAIPLGDEPSMLPQRHAVLCEDPFRTQDRWIVWEVAHHPEFGWTAHNASYLSDRNEATLRLIVRAGRLGVRQESDSGLVDKAASIMRSFGPGIDAGVLALFALGVDIAVIAAARHVVGLHVIAAMRNMLARLGATPSEQE